MKAWTPLPLDGSPVPGRDTVNVVMDELFGRVSKAGRVVCGRQHTDGGYYCVEPVAAIVRLHEPPHYPERRLAPLPGARLAHGLEKHLAKDDEHRRPPRSRGSRVPSVRQQLR